MKNDNLSRRQFVQAVAFFGAAMTLPAHLKARDLPKPEPVIILPDEHPAIVTPNTPFVWIDKMPLIGAYSLEFAMDVRHPWDSSLIVRKRGPVIISIQFEPPILPLLPQIIDIAKRGRIVEIAFSPSYRSSEAVIASSTLMHYLDFQMYGGLEDETVLTTEWACTGIEVVSLDELMKHLGISQRAHVIKPAR